MSDNVFSLPVTVYYEDTDATGVVYHANYLKYFERARTEWLRSLGFDQEKLRLDENIAFTIAGVDVRFLLPARLDNRLMVHVELERFGRASLVLRQKMTLSSEPERIIALAQVKVGCIDANRFRPARFPKSMHAAFAAWAKTNLT